MVTQFLANLKTKDFGPWVKLNQNFWMEAKRELEERYKRDYKDLRAEYWRLAGILEETNDLFYDEWLDVNDAMKDAFSKLVKFERAFLLFDVVTLEDPNYEIFMWHMQLYKDDFDPNAISGINSQEDEDVHKWKLPFRYEDELTDADNIKLQEKEQMRKHRRRVNKNSKMQAVSKYSINMNTGQKSKNWVYT
jgi:hypothetical protein